MTSTPDRVALARLVRILTAAFCDAWGIEPQDARLAAFLFLSRGRALPRLDLAKLVDSHHPPAREAMAAAAERLAPLVGPTGHRNGHYLTPGGMAACRLALNEIGGDLLAMAARFPVISQNDPERA